MSGRLVRAAAMRAAGESFAKIAETLGIHIQSARKAGAGIVPTITPQRNNITRMTPRNGGCSTCSGLVPITMPRIPVLHGAVA